MATARRKDRIGEHRTAFEKNKKIIFKTQKVCGICGQPVDFSYKFPHPLSPTVDHIIPIAKGGHPSDLANLQLAHRTCNRSKSDKLMIVSHKQDQKKEKGKGLPQHYDWARYREAKPEESNAK